MDEHDDDLAPEVNEGEEIESATFEPEDEEGLRNSEHTDEDEQAPSTEDDSEI
jgi:hypothetical protein